MQLDSNTGLVLEGGGMRGVFTSGVLDAFMKHDLYFNYVVAVSAGASGAVFAVMGAMIYAVIRGRGHIEDLSARQVVIMAAFSLYFGFTSEGVDNAAHVGGLICGFLLAVLLYHPSQRAG